MVPERETVYCLHMGETDIHQADFETRVDKDWENFNLLLVLKHSRIESEAFERIGVILSYCNRGLPQGALEFTIKIV